MKHRYYVHLYPPPYLDAYSGFDYFTLAVDCARGWTDTHGRQAEVRDNQRDGMTIALLWQENDKHHEMHYVGSGHWEESK